MRPAYPLSVTRKVPDHIPRPDYAQDGQQPSRYFVLKSHVFLGIPTSEVKRANQPPKILTKEEQEKMRTACRVRPSCLPNKGLLITCLSSSQERCLILLHHTFDQGFQPTS